MKLLILALLLAGLALFASTQSNERRRRGWAALGRARRRGYRFIGGGLLALALVVALRHLGVGFGLIYWTMALGAAGFSYAVFQGVVANQRGWRKSPARRR